MRVLIIGGGGREHALAWKIAQSPQADHVYVAPGNAGTNQKNNVSNIPIRPDELDKLVDFAYQNAIDLTIVGPEQPLALGIVDHFNHHQLPCFGPSQAAAQLETSKAFAKSFMRQYQIPTAEYAYFTDVEKAIDYLANHTFPVVIKASGLAGGKGVIIAEDFEKARQTAYELLSERQFGESGAEIIIEEYLTGEEVSFMAICDGDKVCPLASSKDHKARDDGGKGPNTGGMGAYSPAPVIDQNRYQRLLNEIMQPTLEGLKQSGTPYKGFLYAGVIITPDDKIKVLEFNCRLGDPEAQPVLMRLKSDLLTYLNDACHGRLKTQQLNWYKASALGVVLASQGYPGQYPKGEPITGLNQDDGIETKLFHSGTQKHNDQVLTSGGRVLTCTALGETLDKACYKAYALADHITWPHMYRRSDIGQI